MTENDVAIAPLWGLKELAARWGCSAAIALDRVRLKQVPHIWLGPGEARLTGRGQKFIRFRPRSIELWEAQQESYWDNDKEAPKETTVSFGGLLKGHNAKPLTPGRN